jgi:hypothetical protein
MPKRRFCESRGQEDAEAAGEDRKKEVGRENASGEERFAGLGNVEFYPALTLPKYVTANVLGIKT